MFNFFRCLHKLWYGDAACHIFYYSDKMTRVQGTSWSNDSPTYAVYVSSRVTPLPAAAPYLPNAESLHCEPYKPPLMDRKTAKVNSSFLFMPGQETHSMQNSSQKQQLDTIREKFTLVYLLDFRGDHRWTAACFWMSSTNVTQVENMELVHPLQPEQRDFMRPVQGRSSGHREHCSNANCESHGCRRARSEEAIRRKV